MRIKTNLASMRAFQTYQKNLQKQSTSIGRISSGLKIEASKDNPTAMTKSMRIKSQVSGYQIASRNAQDGVSLMQTADGGLDNISSSLNRLRTLLISVDDTQTDADKQAVQDEIDQILKGIDATARDTEINGVTMLNPDKLNLTDDIIKSPVGPNAGEFVDIKLRDMSTGAIGKTGDEELGSLEALKSSMGFDINDPDSVTKAIDVVDQSMKDVNNYRTELGAISNRFELRSNDIEEISNSFTASESNLTGTDIPLEMADLARSNILVEAGISMMAQTNKMPQQIIEVLNSMRLY